MSTLIEKKELKSKRRIFTSVVQTEQQRAGDGKREEPDDGDHDGHPPPGAVSGVVEQRHSHCCVSVTMHAHRYVRNHRSHVAVFFFSKTHAAHISPPNGVILRNSCHALVYFKVNLTDEFLGSTQTDKTCHFLVLKPEGYKNQNQNQKHFIDPTHIP